MNYDLDLFTRLNDEYRPQPTSPNPPKHDPLSMQEVARRRLDGILNQTRLDLTGKTVMELGAGHGWMVETIARNTGASWVLGVDIRTRPTWDAIDNVEFVVGDLSIDGDTLIAPETVDFVVSTAALEHVTRPLQMIEALYAVLKPGGTAWLYFNLHRGRLASHKYRHVFFPWPHLLFDDETARAYLSERGLDDGWAWVNKLTIGDYFAAFAEVGFRSVAQPRYHTAPIDLRFYERFEDKLGRYPALDLETDFVTVILEKSEVGSMPTPPYVERQRQLDAMLSPV